MWRGILLVACLALGSIVTPARSAAASPGAGQVNPTASVRAKLVLDHTTVTAGTTIKGTWIFTNTTTHPILVNACARDIWDGVSLQDKQLRALTNEPGTPIVQCSPTVELAPGANRFPVKISTSYARCASAGSTSPTCLPHNGGPPPLPPGKYTTKYLIRGMPADFPSPAPLTVTLRTSSLLPAGDGVLIGTAAPCIGPPPRPGDSAHTSFVHMQLRRGSEIVGRQVVTDTWLPTGKVDEQSFLFTEPAGAYTAAEGAKTMPVVIHPGKTTTVNFQVSCI